MATTFKTFKMGKKSLSQCDECRIQGVKLLTMSNYLGIGLDAEISRYFHEERQRHPEHFKSRIYNKTIYAKAIFSQIPTKSRYINNVMTLRTDKEQIPLPNIQDRDRKFWRKYKLQNM